MPDESHDEFLELCAVSTSGQLSQEERTRLQEHLAVCSACREALQQYETIIDHAVPELAPEEPSDVDPGPGWSLEDVEKKFSRRLAQEPGCASVSARDSDGIARLIRQIAPSSADGTWQHVWVLYVAGILLVITFAYCAYLDRH